MKFYDMADQDTLKNLKAGDKHYKAYVGPPQRYDLVGAMQFNLLTSFGIRDTQNLLDIGCGSLRLGKLMIPYLRAGNYYGMEPNDWLIKEGIDNELGDTIHEIKKPSFSNSGEFALSEFGKEFDFIIAQSIFSHASENQIKTCLTEVSKVLKKGGVFLATFVLGDKNYTGSEWVYPGCVEYRHDWILSTIEEHNMKAIQVRLNHPNNQTWYAIFHPGNESNVRNIINEQFEGEGIMRKRPNGLVRAINKMLGYHI